MMPNAYGHLPPETEHLLRDLAPQVLGVLARRTGDFASAEDAVQEALITAAGRWPREGVPGNPRGWLIQAAHRRWTDQVRSESARHRREEATARLEPPPPDGMVPGEDAAGQGYAGPHEDDELTLIFLCCHPSLSQASAIALTLRAVGGLTTAEIAAAFLVPEATMAQRISRAKQQVKAAGATFRLPPPRERAELLRSVRHVLYLMFNEGYTASSGPALHRVDVSDEAIRLTRLLYRAVLGDAETAGLLALMLLTDARRAARTTPDGRSVPLDEQDRTTWDRERIAEGKKLLAGAIARREVGEYQLQAAITEVHDDAPTAEATDWPRILALYGLLEQMTGNPVVTLNRAVAAAMARGPAEGLAVLESAAPALKGHHHVDAVRAYLLELSGDREAAAGRYAAAAGRATSVPERDHFTRKAAELGQKRRLSLGHEDAERVARGIGEDVQRLVFLVRPVIAHGGAQVFRPPALPFQLGEVRHAEVMVHLLGHVVGRPRRRRELVHAVEREHAAAGRVDQHEPVGIIGGPVRGGPVRGWLVAGAASKAEELPVELRESPAVRGVQGRVHQYRESRHAPILLPPRRIPQAQAPPGARGVEMCD